MREHCLRRPRIPRSRQIRSSQLLRLKRHDSAIVRGKRRNPAQLLVPARRSRKGPRRRVQPRLPTSGPSRLRWDRRVKNRRRRSPLLQRKERHASRTSRRSPRSRRPSRFSSQRPSLPCLERPRRLTILWRRSPSSRSRSPRASNGTSFQPNRSFGPGTKFPGPPLFMGHALLHPGIEPLAARLFCVNLLGRMKDIYISRSGGLRRRQDRSTSFFLVLARQQRTTKQNKPYLSLTLGDKTGPIEARVWEPGDPAHRQRFRPRRHRQGARQRFALRRPCAVEGRSVAPGARRARPTRWTCCRRPPATSPSCGHSSRQASRA